MSWIDKFFVGIATVLVSGTPVPQRGGLNLVAGTNVTIAAADNQALNRTDVTISATGGGGGGSVTGTGLFYAAGSVLNGAAVTLSGDVSPSALSAGNLPITVNKAAGGAIVFGSGSTQAITLAANQNSPGLFQATAASDISTISMIIGTQAAFAAATSNRVGGSIALQPGAGATTNGTYGSILAILGVPTGTGSEAYFGVARNGLSLVTCGALSTINHAYGTVFLGNVTPGPTTYAISSDAATQLAINAVGGPINFSQAGTQFLSLSSTSQAFSAGTVVAISHGTTSGATPANFLVQPQTSTNAAANGSTLQIDIGATAGAGTEGTINFTRAGVSYANLGPFQGSPTIGVLWLGLNGVAPSITNFSFAHQPTGGNTYINSTNQFYFSIGGPSSFVGMGMNATGFQLFDGENFDFGGGTGVLSIAVCATNPSSNPTTSNVLYTEVTSLNLRARGVKGAITTIAASGSSGTIAGQAQVYDEAWGTVTTALTATATAFPGYTTTTGQGGSITVTCVSVATATATGIVIGDTAVSTYLVGFKNVGGTVTLSSAGPTLLTGTNQTTAAALTAPVISATVATNVITFKVSNAAISTCRSQIFLGNTAC